MRCVTIFLCHRAQTAGLDSILYLRKMKLRVSQLKCSRTWALLRCLTPLCSESITVRKTLLLLGRVDRFQWDALERGEWTLEDSQGKPWVGEVVFQWERKSNDGTWT